MTVKARELAGPTADCKSVREGFDSLPGLQDKDWKAEAQKWRGIAVHHHEKSVDAQTKLMEIREKLIAAQKELSRLKRNK